MNTANQNAKSLVLILGMRWISCRTFNTKEMTYFLKYDEWFDKYHDVIYLELAENGADREMDFNPEEEFRIRYKAYLKTKER